MIVAASVAIAWGVSLVWGAGTGGLDPWCDIDQHQAYGQQQCGATQAEHAHGLQVAAQDDRQQQAAQGNEDRRNE